MDNWFLIFLILNWIEISCVLCRNVEWSFLFDESLNVVVLMLFYNECFLGWVIVEIGVDLLYIIFVVVYWIILEYVLNVKFNLG